MEDLTKQQLILVAILISFVTSLATGIVTVALMDQAPSGVTRTITQVIQQSVATASGIPGASSTASVGAGGIIDVAAEATAVIAPSVVLIRDRDSRKIHGQGLIVSEKGIVMTDKTAVDGIGVPEMVLFDGTSYPVTTIRYQIQGDIAFIAPINPIAKKLKPISFTNSIRLGSTVWSVSGPNGQVLSQGIIDEYNTATSSPVIHTSIQPSRLLPGAPLFTASGAVAGIYTDSMPGRTEAVFYSVNSVRNDVPK